uniref:Uncharacterized protein n=1 Tax=Arundo donax TaxID=35708 RepID=A0A0A9EU10_ARUDO
MLGPDEALDKEHSAANLNLRNRSIYYPSLPLYPCLAGAVADHSSSAALTRFRILSRNFSQLLSAIQPTHRQM